MKNTVILMTLLIIGAMAFPAEAATTKAKYIANCVKFSQQVNPQMRTDMGAQKSACTCICEQVEAMGASEEDLRTIMKYTREYDFTTIPKQPTFQQILQAHVDVHRDILKTQDDLELFVKSMMSCSGEAQ